MESRKLNHHLAYKVWYKYNPFVIIRLTRLTCRYPEFPVQSHGDPENNNFKNIGAIIDVDSRLGKEEKVAVEVAVQNFNDSSRNHKLSLHFQGPERDSLQVASAGICISYY